MLQRNDNITFQNEKLSEELSESNIDTCNEQSKKKYKCTYSDCHATFSLPSRLENHVRVHTGERPYKCQHEGCTKSYTNSSHLKRHLQTHNPIKKLYQCTVCLLEISNLHNLKRHYKRVHGNTQIACKECDKTFNKKKQLVMHQATHDESKIYKCDKCNKVFTNNYRFKKHQETYKETKKYPCLVPECSEVFNKWLLLCAHRKAKHPTEYKCNSCNRIFHNKSKLRCHSKIHSENRTVLRCTYDRCHRMYYFKSNLEHHVKVKHLGAKFFCDICSLGLSSKRRLIDHIQRHQENEEKVSKIKKKFNGQRKKRKDAGTSKKSMLTQLIGLNLPNNLEKLVLKRTEEEVITIDNEECDKSSNYKRLIHKI